MFADFVLAWWNAESRGGVEFSDLWAVYRPIADHTRAVVAFLVRRGTRPSSFSLSGQFGEVPARWRPQLAAVASPP